MANEKLLAKRLANYLKTNYPNQPFRFDIGADMFTNIKIAKDAHALHGKWSKGYPDLFIPAPTKKWHGLFLELKDTPTVPHNRHTDTQRAYHNTLVALGYKACFCCGFDDCVAKLEKYMKKSKWRKEDV